MKRKTRKFEEEFSNGVKIGFYSACAVVEGFSGNAESIEDQMRAWAWLIKTGHVWHLQGFYGRAANDLIEGGVINHQGIINWENVNVYEE